MFKIIRATCDSQNESSVPNFLSFPVSGSRRAAVAHCLLSQHWASWAIRTETRNGVSAIYQSLCHRHLDNLENYSTCHEFVRSSFLNSPLRAPCYLHWKCELARIMKTKYTILRFGFWCNQVKYLYMKFRYVMRCDDAEAAVLLFMVSWGWCLISWLRRWGEITKGESWLLLHSWPPAGPWSHVNLSLIV